MGFGGKPRPTKPVDLRREIATAISEDPAASPRTIAVRRVASPTTVPSVRDELRVLPVQRESMRRLWFSRDPLTGSAATEGSST